jgi:hypothetical protein
MSNAIFADEMTGLCVETGSVLAKQTHNPERPVLMNITQISLRLREQMEVFLGNLPACKPARRFALEALYGIASRGSLKLSEIARSLNESIALIKTENRLSRQAARPGLAEVVRDWVIARAEPYVGDNPLLIIDPSDIAKPYAHKMEYLARVRDGSKKEQADGYWLCQVLAVDRASDRLVPLVNHLWSHRAPGFKSENHEIMGCIAAVADRLGQRGLWVMDRGGDRGKIFEPLLGMQQRFLIRLRADRTLLLGQTPLAALTISEGCPLPYAECVRRQNSDGTETTLTLEFGFRPVRLPGHGRPLHLLVIKGFGREPLMVLTTEALRQNRKALWAMVEAYLTRWRIEETLRFAKQAYELEDVRVLGYQSLKNMMAMALLAMFFAMVHLGVKAKLEILCHHALKAAKRLFGIPDFRFYAIADGIREILTGRRKPPFAPRTGRHVPPAQLDLFAFADP